MEIYEKKKVRLQRITAIAVILILLLMLWASFGVSQLVHVVKGYEDKVDIILYRLDSFSAELDSLDLDGLTSTLTALSSDLEDADIAGLSAGVQKMLSEVDWKALSDNLNSMSDDARKSLELAEEALQKVIQAVDDLDVESLNKAVTDLQSVIEPLASFTARFK